jgi:hypothetical protein
LTKPCLWYVMRLVRRNYMTDKLIDFSDFVVHGQNHDNYLPETPENFPNLYTEPFLCQKNTNSWLRSWTQNECTAIHGYVQADAHYSEFLKKLLENKSDVELRKAIEALSKERYEFFVNFYSGELKFMP